MHPQPVLRCSFLFGIAKAGADMDLSGMFQVNELRIVASRPVSFPVSLYHMGSRLHTDRARFMPKDMSMIFSIRRQEIPNPWWLNRMESGPRPMKMMQ